MKKCEKKLIMTIDAINNFLSIIALNCVLCFNAIEHLKIYSIDLTQHDKTIQNFRHDETIQNFRHMKIENRKSYIIFIQNCCRKKSKYQNCYR